MDDQSATGKALLNAAIRGDEEAVWSIAANETYADLAYNNPRSIWPEVLATLDIANEEMAAAISTCLLEHMLEVDFEFFHEAISRSMLEIPMLAEGMSIAGKFGQSRLPSNSANFDALTETARRLRQRN